MVRVVNTYESQFEKILSEKKVICFGAGDELIRICRKYSELAERITVIADNNKEGSMVINGMEKKMCSISQIKSVDPDVILIISTVRYADEIVRQLDDIEIFNGIDTYIPYCLAKDNGGEVIIPDGPEIIPRKIHYCWFGNAPIPKKFLENIDSWKKFCPDYEIIFWNESNYDIEKNKYMSEAYKMKKWGFVPDYARLDIVNTHGGIYMDTDVELIRNIDELLRFKLFCGFESKDYVAFGLGFGGSANNDILSEMLDEYDKMSFINPDGTLNLTPSPVYQTEQLKKHGLKCNGTFQNIEGAAVFPPEYFAPMNSLGVGMPTEKTYSIHQYAATWHDQEMAEKKKKTVISINYIKKRIENNK